MNYRHLAHKLRINPIPFYIDWWPEKEIHRLATYKKSIREAKDEDLREDIKEVVKKFVQEQELLGRRYSAYLTETSKERARTGDWGLIPEQAWLAWESAIYNQYENLYYKYQQSLGSTTQDWAERFTLGRQLLHIEEVQAARLERIGPEQVKRNIAIRARFFETRIEAGQTSPTDEELSEAYSEMDVNGTYQFPPGEQVALPGRVRTLSDNFAEEYEHARELVYASESDSSPDDQLPALL